MFNAQKALQAKNYFGTSEPGPDDATGAEAAAGTDPATAGCAAGAVTAAPPSKPAEAAGL